MPSPSTSARALQLRVSNRSIFLLWAALIAGLVLLTGGLVLFAGSAGEPPAEALILVLVGLGLTLTAGARIACVRLAALYTVSKHAITAR